MARAIGAPPMVSAARLERSAAAKRGWATMSWAMAGTMKAATGRRSSIMRQPLARRRSGAGTTRSARRASARRRAGRRWWSRTGRRSRSRARSSPAGRVVRSVARSGTTTALGDPVVPEVYMMSMTSAGPVGRRTRRAPSRRGRTAPTSPVAPGQSVGRGHHPEPAQSVGQLGPRRRRRRWRPGQDGGGLGVGEDRPELRAGQPGVDGNGDGTGPVHGGVGDEPGERLVGADGDDHPVPGVEAAVGEPPGQPVGPGVPGRRRSGRTRRPGCARPTAVRVASAAMAPISSGRRPLSTAHILRGCGGGCRPSSWRCPAR